MRSLSSFPFTQKFTFLCNEETTVITARSLMLSLLLMIYDAPVYGKGTQPASGS